jgi:hypothetical protein
MRPAIEHRGCHKTLAVDVDSSNAAAMALHLARDFLRLTQAGEND